jgi:hypothetical protein
MLEDSVDDVSRDERCSDIFVAAHCREAASGESTQGGVFGCAWKTRRTARVGEKVIERSNVEELEQVPTPQLPSASASVWPGEPSGAAQSALR